MNRAFDAIVLGASPTGLYAVRELAQAGLRVALADTTAGCAFHSRYIAAGPAARCRGDVVRVADWLRRIADAQPATPLLLVPSNDVFIEFLLQHGASLPANVRYAGGYRGLAAELLDKARFHALCAAHGMATPGVWRADGAAALPALADSLPYPCILKPELIHRAKDFLKGRKVLLARDADDYRRQVAGIPPDSGQWLVQEIIPGPESAITLFGGYADAEGRLQAVFTGRKLRQYPPGFGSASLVRSEPCAETHAMTADFIRRIGLRGVFGAEYKRDPRDGRLKIIEINPRPTLWFQIAHDAGLRPVAAMAADLLGLPPPPVMAQDGAVVWRYALKDAASALFYARHGRDFVFPAPDVSGARASRRSWPVFAWRDPLPALMEPVGFLRKAWRRLI
jgi:D-aspartate ligase